MKKDKKDEKKNKSKNAPQKAFDSFPSETPSDSRIVHNAPSTGQSMTIAVKKIELKEDTAERLSLFTQLCNGDNFEAFVKLCFGLNKRLTLTVDLATLKYDIDNEFWSQSNVLRTTVIDLIEAISNNLSTSSMPYIETYFKGVIETTLNILFDTVSAARLDKVLDANISIIQDPSKLITVYKLKQALSSFVTKDQLKRQISELVKIKSDTEIFTIQIENYSAIQKHLSDLSESLVSQRELLITFDPIFSSFEYGSCYSFITTITEPQMLTLKQKIKLLQKDDAAANIAVRQISFILDKIEYIRKGLNSGDYIKSVFLSLPSVEIVEDHEGLAIFIQPFDLSVESYEKTLNSLTDSKILGENIARLPTDVNISQLDVLKEQMPDIFSVYSIKTAANLFDLFFPVNLTLVKKLMNITPVVYEKAQYTDNTSPLINDNGSTNGDYVTKETLIGLLTNTKESEAKFSKFLPDDLLYLLSIKPNQKTKIENFSEAPKKSDLDKLSAHSE